MTFEKLINAKLPKRVEYMRVIIMELSRIADHLVCNSVIGVDTGAFTGFIYVFEFRELIYEIFEEICGSRLTTNIGRIGGFERNFTDIVFKNWIIFKDLSKGHGRVRNPIQSQPYIYGTNYGRWWNCR